MKILQKAADSRPEMLCQQEGICLPTLPLPLPPMGRALAFSLALAVVMVITKVRRSGQNCKRQQMTAKR